MIDYAGIKSRAGSHAIVIGGSMAGLLAARVLADHFDHVTIVERDRLPEGPAPRKGLPQARHIHQILVQGKLILEQLFPGLEAETIRAGAVPIELPADLMWFSPVGWGCRFRSDLMTYACSRDLLEWGVRRRVATYGGVRFLEACDVIDLLPNSDKTGVAGVRMRPRDRTGAETAGTADLSADLVIDASGRSSRAPHWLEALSYMPPAETTINSFLGYATCIYACPPGMPVDWKALLIQARPPVSARGGGLYPLEGDRLIVTLAGAARDYPPIDEAGFLEFARTLASPLLYEAIKDAEPLSPIYGYQRTENRLRHYERLTSWPEGFVVLGDAVCAFNPVYGQGMTAAAQAALLLEHCLRAQRQRNAEVRGMARRFQRQLARINTVPWLLATGEDFRYPATEGGQPNRITRLMHRYIDRVMLCAVEHPDVFTAFLEVAHLLKPPAVLLRPDILARVLVDAFEPIVNLRTEAFKKLRSRV